MAAPKYLRSREALDNELVRQIAQLNANLGAGVAGGAAPSNAPVVAKLDEVKAALAQNRDTFLALREDQAENASALREIGAAVHTLTEQQADAASGNMGALADLKTVLGGNDTDTHARIDAMKVRIAASVDALREEAKAQHAETQDDLNALLAKMELARTERTQQMAALLAAVQAPDADLFEARVRSGMQTMYNTGLQVVAAAGNLRISVTNPANSARLVWFDRIIVSHSTTTALTGDMRFGPGLTGTPALTIGTLAGKNMRPGLNPDTALAIRLDFNATTALAGGVGTPVAFIVGPTSRNTLNENAIAIGPGVEMGLNLKFSAASSAVLQIITHSEPV